MTVFGVAYKMLLLRWNARALIDAVGGAGVFAEECARKGYGSITPKAVRKWKERNSMPSAGLAVAALLLSSKGHAITTFIDKTQPLGESN